MAERKKVLVVEDETFLRMLAADTLKEAGFKTLEVADAEEALQVLERESEVAAVVTDVVLPGPIDGLELAAQIADERPEIALVVTSGSRAVSVTEVPDGGVFLPKPYEPSELVETIIKQLDHVADRTK